MFCRREWLGLLLAVFTIGCPAPPATPTPTAAPIDPATEKAVREQFANLQTAIKDRDFAKLWALLDAKSQADAEQQAKVIKAAYAKANADEKAKLETRLGLSGKDLAELTGVGYLKTTLFHRSSHEVPGSKVVSVTAEGEKYNVQFVEADGDRAGLYFYPQDGQFRARLVMPPFTE
jgi:hypothetical protein